MPGKIDKVAFVTVKVMRCSYCPVQVKGTNENAILNSVAVL